MKPAPADTYASLTFISNPSGRPSNVGSSESEYCVLAIQIGRLPNPNCSSCAICLLAAAE